MLSSSATMIALQLAAAVAGVLTPTSTQYGDIVNGVGSWTNATRFECAHHNGSHDQLPPVAVPTTCTTDLEVPWIEDISMQPDYGGRPWRVGSYTFLDLIKKTGRPLAPANCSEAHRRTRTCTRSGAQPRRAAGHGTGGLRVLAVHPAEPCQLCKQHSRLRHHVHVRRLGVSGRRRLAALHGTVHGRLCGSVLSSRRGARTLVLRQRSPQTSIQ